MVSLLFLPHIRMIIYYKPLLRAGTKSHSVLHARAWYSLWFTGGNGVGAGGDEREREQGERMERDGEGGEGKKFPALTWPWRPFEAKSLSSFLVSSPPDCQGVPRAQVTFLCLDTLRELQGTWRPLTHPAPYHICPSWSDFPTSPPYLPAQC